MQIIEWVWESVVSEKDIPSGTVIEDMVWVKRPWPWSRFHSAKDLKGIGVKTVVIFKDRQIKWRNYQIKRPCI